MRKLIFSINMTLDGYIDHTAMIADDELHERASELIKNADIILFGRITYQLMAESWPTAPSDPSLSPSVKEFAQTINGIQKIVYSKTLENVSWNTRIVREIDPVEINEMKNLPGKSILLGPGPNVARTFMKFDLIDEYRFVMHPVILGKGMPLFTDDDERKDLLLVDQFTLQSGVVELIYQRKNQPSNHRE
jgi:dihydrofolate reductase